MISLDEARDAIRDSEAAVSQARAQLALDPQSRVLQKELSLAQHKLVNARQILILREALEARREKVQSAI